MDCRKFLRVYLHVRAWCNASQYIVSACSRVFVFLSNHFVSVCSRNVFKKYENMAIVTRLMEAGKGVSFLFLEDSS